MKEVDHDGSPLVAEEVEHLPLQRSCLEGSTGAERDPDDDASQKFTVSAERVASEAVLLGLVRC